MHKLNGPFKASIAAGNRWAKTVLPRIRGERRRQVAVLYPAQMALVEGFTTAEGNQRRRLDSLGCFQAVCDSGLMADVLHPDQVAAGALKDYKFCLRDFPSIYQGDNANQEQMDYFNASMELFRDFAYGEPAENAVTSGSVELEAASGLSE